MRNWKGFDRSLSYSRLRGFRRPRTGGADTSTRVNPLILIQHILFPFYRLKNSAHPPSIIFVGNSGKRGRHFMVMHTHVPTILTHSDSVPLLKIEHDKTQFPHYHPQYSAISRRSTLFKLRQHVHKWISLRSHVSKPSSSIDLIDTEYALPYFFRCPNILPSKLPNLLTSSIVLVRNSCGLPHSVLSVCS